MIERYREYAAQVAQVLDPTGRRTAKLCLTPYRYDARFWEQMGRVTSAYASLLEFVFRQFPVNRKIQEALEYPPELERYLGSLTIYPRNLAAARLDTFVTSAGLRLVESNTEIPGGNEESYFLEQEYQRLLEPPGLTAVPRMAIVYDTLMRHYALQAEHLGMPRKEHLVIYLSQWQSEIERIRGEYDVLMSFLREHGHRCDVVDPNAIEIRDDQAFGPDGTRIDLIYRRFTADELPRFARRSWQLAIDWDRAQVAVVNPFCTKRVDSKNIMVLLKDERYDDVFPAELADALATVREIIPWTKKVKERLVIPDGQEVAARPWLLAERERLVIKHANAYSSAAVYLGEDATPARWEEIVDEALTGDWIVQERIELPLIDLDYFEDDQVKQVRCIYNISPYIYDGQLGGFLGRASTDKLTSFKSGEIATIIPCFQSPAA